MQNYQQDNGLGKQDDQPESVLNIIRKEFFDMGGHDKDDDLKSVCVSSVSPVESPFYGLTKSAEPSTIQIQLPKSPSSAAF